MGREQEAQDVEALDAAHTPRDSREFLEASGERVHLFVDSAEGVTYLYDRGKASQRALARLRALTARA